MELYTAEEHNPLIYIEKIDLYYLAMRVVEKLNWSLAEAQEQIGKYKNFLILQFKYGKEGMLVPTLKIDEVWHNHILHTQAYFDDCQHIFGHYLHHEPTPYHPDPTVRKKFADETAECFLKTQVLYEMEFNEPFLEHSLFE